MADGFPPLEAHSLGHIDFADDAVVQHLHSFDLVIGSAALHADLHHAVVFARRLHHLAAFPDFVAGGLLDVNVFAGLAGPDGGEGMPVIARGDGDRVDIFVFEKLADVLISFLRLVTGELVSEGYGALDLRLVDIANTGNARLRQFGVAGDVVAAAAAYADHGDVDAIVGAPRGHAGGHGNG